MTTKQLLEPGTLVLLPGAVLARVQGCRSDSLDMLVVDRWSSAAPSGWRWGWDVAADRVAVEGVEAHHCYAAAMARRGEEAS